MPVSTAYSLQHEGEIYTKQLGSADLLATCVMDRSLVLIILLVAANFAASTRSCS
ncbi:hypothetical protein [Aeromonas sp. SER]|uniref:hypothetical protein n=1 Tax=Aeromonas sp. SER TaxID=3135721 RepID=UPI0031619327